MSERVLTPSPGRRLNLPRGPSALADLESHDLSLSAAIDLTAQVFSAPNFVLDRTSPSSPTAGYESRDC